MGVKFLKSFEVAPRIFKISMVWWFFFKWFPTSRSWLVFLRPIFRVEFFLFRIIFKGISFHYSKKPSPRGWFCHLPLAVRAASRGCYQSPSPWGLAASPRGLSPSPRFSGGWGWGLPQPPGAGGCLSPRGLRQSPVFGGSPQKSQPPQKIVCVGGGFLEILMDFNSETL